MQDAASPHQKRWLQFTLRDCLVASVAIAVTFAPFQLYERFNPPSHQVILRGVVYEADSEKLREVTRDWDKNQLHATSQEQVTAVVNSLKRINVVVLVAPTLVMVHDQEANFMVGNQIPMPSFASIGTKTVTATNVGVRFSVKPAILPNGRVRFNLECTQSTMMVGKEVKRDTKQVIFAAPDQDIQEPQIKVQTMSIPTELAPKETIFIVDAGDQTGRKGTVIQIQLDAVK